MNHRIRRGAMALALLAGTITTASIVDSSVAGAAGPTNINFSIKDNFSANGTVYIDAWWGTNSSPCFGNSPNGSGYDAAFNWSAPGDPVGLVTKPMGGAGNGPWPTAPTFIPSSASAGCPSGASILKVRLEIYPNSVGVYDPWAGNVGGAHAEQQGGGVNFGKVSLPTVGENGAFRITGNVVSSTPVMDDRLRIDMFQVACHYPDSCPALKNTDIVPNIVGAFSSSRSKAAEGWTGWVGWPGRYQMYIYDCSTGWTGSNTCAGVQRNVLGFMDIAEGDVPDIDLDAPCFGMYLCKYQAGGILPTTGEFHPLVPTRLMDTRVLGNHQNGKITRGDGAMLPKNAKGDPMNQIKEAKNHELKVTGVAGIPESGVAAVLLNVTAVAPPGTGWLSVYPRPPVPPQIDDVSALYDNQATFQGTLPATSNLNVVPGQTVPNLVLARVGAGGTIRFWNANPGGPMDVLVDVAGWFDTGEGTFTAPTSTGGLGFTPVTPARLLNTRDGVGAPAERLERGDVVELQVRDLPDIPIPADAESVVINITAGSPTTTGFVTAYPSDLSTIPNVSNLNVNGGITRANLAVVKVGPDHKIKLAVGSGRADLSLNLFVDILGYFSESGGDTTIINPTRVFDTRQGHGPVGPFSTVNVKVANTFGIPAGVTAVMLNVTAIGTTSGGYLTIYEKGVPQPDSSNINWPGSGRDTPNMVMVGVSADGFITIFNERGSTGVLVDVFGYVL